MDPFSDSKSNHSHNAPYPKLIQKRGSQGTISSVGSGKPLMSQHSALPFANLPNHSSDSLSKSISDKYSLSPWPQSWGAPLLMSHVEPDDDLHNPDPRRDRRNDYGGSIFTARGLKNVGCLAILVLGMMSLFAGYPIITHFLEEDPSKQGGFNLGGINATGQIPDIPGNFGLIDKDTPREAYTKMSYLGTEEFVLVFSDEFNQEGRTFYPGDDPYWEAVDLHYWGTNDLEWYDPQQATTRNGHLEIRIDEVADNSTNHNMQFRSGMIQTWNKFCFTGGLIEAMVRLPGFSDVAGLWPAVWTMGNLGRAGYGATNDGMWPYTYDSCDVGTLPNQTYPGTNLPEAALINGDPSFNNVLSFLPGQRLSACTCRGESHPGPVKPDGSYVGRSAPEIDMIEATVTNGVGHVSLSAQWAPYNAGYRPLNVSGGIIIDDPSITVLNEYRGGVYQQTTSGLANTNQTCYEMSGGCFTVYGFEYKPGFDEGYATWVNNNERAWTIFSGPMGPDPLTEIDARPFPQEPMYIITNLGISHNFAAIDFENLRFPAIMSIDWIRVYQPRDAINIGCDPKEFPTRQYIETYMEAYTNPNLTTWEQFGQPWPKNRLIDDCT
ncbi:beta-glucan synthesis-associated protein KRE6 [Coprinopsis cinerea okayama7|uniref:Beta-glucan synthesis-associated protein KRE6 n=1 Tax=Coprinopsis cinerea (strain Okayama-7 / 130 / ATCC MYA-4618 / FGSC 9003) TaxID=240176 RepID=A8NEH8_COPC7|nr:beta-glucan synthesis-associated protein KRE6 [Coprinopsis cinerea okayama7\|eukprot:XP_001833030.1 beta-glucan synthesis-associated protein KRE6 [Coprinopsis cinerea okayama7\